MASPSSTAPGNHSDLRVDTDPALMPDLDDGPRCECPHTAQSSSSEQGASTPCGAPARWRVTIDCVCGASHPRRVELLCARCLSNRSSELGRERLTVRGI